MSKNENRGGDFEMRIRFAKQPIRFWEKSENNEGGYSPFVRQDSGNVPPKGERPEPPHAKGASLGPSHSA